MIVKVGDFVRVKNLNQRPNYFNQQGLMDRFFGQVVQVIGVFVDRILFYDDENDRNWSVRINDLEPAEIDNRKV